MVRTTHLLVFGTLLISLTACNLAPATATLPTTQTLPPTLDQLPATETPTIPTPQPSLPDEEAIFILQPGPGSRVTSPVHVAGVANPTFEQHLAVSIVLDDGSVPTTVPAIINAELGQRGSYEVDIPLSLTEERQGFIQVYDTSARDGGILHLASVGVILAPSGSENIIIAELHSERIAIFQPAPGAAVSGGMAHVEGFALASFEQTLLVQVLDAAGSVVGQQSATVTAPDVGQPGPFRVDVPYTVSCAGVGRIVVRDVSPAFGGDAHVTSAEVNLNP